MKILFINGSPEKNGNTAALAKELLNGKDYGGKDLKDGKGKTMAEKQTAGKDRLRKIAPEFAQLNDDVLFGEVWATE